MPACAGTSTSGDSMDRIFVNTSDIPWVDGIDVIRSFTRAFREQLGPADEVEDVYRRYHQKTLRHETGSKRRLDLIRIDAGYRDLTNSYHDSVEECLVLEGSLSLDGEGEFEAGDYFWRPPGWVHAAGTDPGFVALLGFEGDNEGEGSRATSRNIRPDEEAGTNALHPHDIENAVGPRGWVRRLQTGNLQWLPGPLFARTQQPLDGMDLDRLQVKILSHNPWTGGQTLLIRLMPGYHQRGRGSHSSSWEHYVTEGECRLGDEVHTVGCYLMRRSGRIEPPMVSQGGAVLYVKVDGWLDRRRVV